MIRPFFRWKDRPEVGEFLVAHYARVGVSDMVIALNEKFGVHVTPGAVSGYFCSRKKNGSVPDQEPEPAPIPSPDEVFPDQRQRMTEAETETFFIAAMEEGERKEGTFLGQTALTVNKASEALPIGVAFWGDWQIGTSGVLLRQLKQDAETIAAAEGLFCFPIGDLVQNLNQRKHPSSLHECILADPRDQQRLAKHILQKTREKIWGMVTGNHEENTKQASGFTLTEQWCEDLGVPYLWHGAKVTLKLGSQVYRLGIRHKFPNESSINTTNAQRNIHLKLWPDADVVCMGDKHYNDMQKTPKPLGDTIFLRSGAYQHLDDFGMSLAQYKGQWGIPIVVFFPDTHLVVPFYGKDFHIGLEFLEDQRARYRKKIPAV